MKKLELLSPAKNLEYGKEAINHGADAVYIGSPRFGARVAAANSLQDIEDLINYAHIFGSKVYVTLNTLLFDHELEEIQKLIHTLYNIGVDALIVQDLGILELDLPPIALHASTQTHNIDVQRISFLEKVGFQRVILGRELSLEAMNTIRQSTTVELEAFVLGALCVCYSGQCYLSQSLNEHSGNRGCCSQPCRSAYNLYNEDGKQLMHNAHLLSLKDFSGAQHLREMIKAGISSFKIEGRLKDLSYVKNVTAHYRTLLDEILTTEKDYSKSSSGQTKLFFTPDLERTFNRGFTDYFLRERQPMASFLTQKSLGKKIGKVLKSDRNTIIIDSEYQLTPGDGLCFFNENNELEGFLVNRVEKNKVWLNKAVNIKNGTELFRNNDYTFEKALQSNKSSERKIGVDLSFTAISEGFKLTIKDEDGNECSEHISTELTPSTSPEKVKEQMIKQLSKMGDTPFHANKIEIIGAEKYFLPASVINDVRRKAINKLIDIRIQANKPLPCTLETNNEPYFKAEVGYRENIINNMSARFYERHGAKVLEHGLEKTKEYKDKALMTTKYCIRYEMGQCLKRHNVTKEYQSNLYLENNRNIYRLQFNCKECEMQIFLSDINFRKNR